MLKPKKKVVAKKKAPKKLTLTKKLAASGVKASHVKRVNKTKSGVVIKVGKQTVGTRSTKIDKERRALSPGKRLSVAGKIYYEHRKNHSDSNPDRGL